MLEKSIELEYLYENNNINNSLDIYNEFQNPLDFSNISAISKSKFAQHYHFLCKHCNRVPTIKFIKDCKIRYICECKDSSKDLNIKEIYNYLYYFDELDFGIEYLKCYLHSKEYGYYCEKCKKNLCPQCFSDCSDHKNMITSLVTKNNAIDKYNYIYKKIKDKNQNYINIESDSFDYNNKPKSNNIILQNNENESSFIKNEDSYFLTPNKNEISIFNNEKIEFINIMEKNNNDEIYDNEYYYINLFTIILNDYLNFPNVNLIEAISEMEIYLILYFHDYNKIYLNYEFPVDNFKLNEIKILGENFVNNNKENSFLIINEKIIELNSFINLYDIFDDIILHGTFQLDVILFERKCKSMTDLSYMFDGISTLTSKSNFFGFNNNNIRKMNYFFNGCKLLKKLPDISEINTENVTDMSYMFNNCLSLTDLPNISKWKTENVKDISYMFNNCKMLTSLPNISKWNTSNIDKIEGIFNNCKSLSNLPNLAKWNIREDIKDDNIFEGCYLLEVKLQNNNYKCKKLFDCLKIISPTLNKLSKCFLNYIPYISVIYFIYLFFYYQIISFYNSLYLTEIKEIVSNPAKYFYLEKHANFTYMDEIFIITQNNKTYLLENKEFFLNNVFNFTYFNDNIKFEIYEKKIKKTSITNFIFIIIKYTLLFFSIFYFRKIKLSNAIKIIHLFAFILLNAFSMVFEIRNIIVGYKLFRSLNKFFEVIQIFFKIEISQFVVDAKNKIHISYISDSISLTISIFFIGLSVFGLTNRIEEITILRTYNDYLTSGIN